MDKIIKSIDEEIKEYSNKAYLTAYNMEIEKAKARDKGIVIGLELAKQIINGKLN